MLSVAALNNDNTPTVELELAEVWLLPTTPAVAVCPEEEDAEVWVLVTGAPPSFARRLETKMSNRPQGE